MMKSLSPGNLCQTNVTLIAVISKKQGVIETIPSSNGAADMPSNNAPSGCNGSDALVGIIKVNALVSVNSERNPPNNKGIAVNGRKIPMLCWCLAIRTNQMPRTISVNSTAEMKTRKSKPQEMTRISQADVSEFKK